ncbi:hypothetical protein G6O69_05030 [Pseudenhygromyxa sp. WMMC2535]|uniref:hypothetical protein n=1 Tax=Pseudenhygromyxa sp. WMMC2535 TaxID=2712867 RepID=UPI0015951BB6|nr:hypothetical protein [Pseudenhygromyxa sp. WMMC2535]NVB37184.1 hypothetical protein [Pseudenhygromyxa sp. WMMC2535]
MNGPSSLVVWPSSGSVRGLLRELGRSCPVSSSSPCVHDPPASLLRGTRATPRRCGSTVSRGKIPVLDGRARGRWSPSAQTWE